MLRPAIFCVLVALYGRGGADDTFVPPAELDTFPKPIFSD